MTDSLSTLSSAPSDTLSLDEAISSMPKAELHLHIEGTLEPELALELAERNGVALPWTNIEALKEQYAFENLQSFLDLYYQLMAVLKTADDFRDLMLAYLARANADGVRHAEIFFDPQVHVDNGLDVDTVMDGLLDGLAQGKEQYGITGGLILCIVRDMPVESAEHILDLVEHRSGDLLGIGLDSAEVGYPPSLFTHVFERARTMGLRTVAHAGEEGPSGYITEALDALQVERIDHGARSSEDLALVKRLAEQNVALTMCPLSNLRLQVVSNLRQLPIRQLLDAGVPVTINSDDPAYFGGYIAANYRALADIGYTISDLECFSLNAINHSFAGAERTGELVEAFENWLHDVGSRFSQAG
jgi:adenosine deaminase